MQLRCSELFEYTNETNFIMPNVVGAWGFGTSISLENISWAL